MDSKSMVALVVIAVLWVCLAVDSVSEGSSEKSCRTMPCVYFEYGFGNTLDTFSGTFARHTIEDQDTTVALSLTEDELWKVFSMAISIGFFSYPDTVRSHPGSDYSPNPGPDKLRIKVGDRDRTVVWYYPIDGSWPHWKTLLALSDYIQHLVESKEQVKTLTGRIK